MKNKTRINNYFDWVKKNPPLITLDKVHQILNKTEVKAKVKKGHSNLLKFTIMTTVFAIIISAFLFWPKGQEEIPNNIKQNSNKQEQPINSIQIDSVKHYSNLTKMKNTHASTLFVNKEAQEIDTAKKEAIQFNSIGYAIYYSSNNTGADFEIILNKKRSFNLQNKDSTIWLSISSDETKKLVSGNYQFSESDQNILHQMTFSGQYYIHPDEAIKIVGGKITIDTSRANHSMVYEFILENKQKILGNYLQKPVEKVKNNAIIEKPKQEFIYPEQILDSTLFIELNKSQLENLGFKQNNDAIELFCLTNTFVSYRDGSLIFGVNIDDSPSPKSHKDITKFHFEAKHAFLISKDKNKSDSNNGKVIPMLITNWEGNNLLKMAIPEIKLKTLFSKRFSNDFKTLLPVVVKKNIFGNHLPQDDIVYWFLPTDEFFNRLPPHISEEILAEYDYITTEDKSILEKPECKYFDECKNTLDVSNFKVFPNPANSTATVSFTLNEPVDGRITLVDLAGRERQVLQAQTTLSSGNHRFDLDVGDVPEGIYLITLFSDKGIQTQRFIVAR